MITAHEQPIGRAGHALYVGDRVRVVPVERDGEVYGVDAVRQRVEVRLFDGLRTVETAAAYCRKK